MTKAREQMLEGRVRELLSQEKELREDLEFYKKVAQGLDNQLREMAERAEESFLDSPAYRQMKSRNDYLEAALKLKERHVQNKAALNFKTAEAARQVYEDNQRFAEHAGDVEYFAGITGGRDAAAERVKRMEETDDLRGRLSAMGDLLAERDAEIKRLQKNVAELETKLRRDQTKTPGKRLEHGTVMGRAR